MKSSSKMMIIAAIVLLVSLPGCSLKNGSETKPIEKSNTVQNAGGSRPLPTASKIDPVKAEESKNSLIRD
ncbi:MAG: hypothetical protein AB9895_06500 [Negativicutes bacterium]